MASWRIAELLKEFPETSVIEANEIYSITLKSPSTSTKYSLLINLPPRPGPDSPPILFCDPAIPRHSMISSDGRVELRPGMGADGDLVAIIRTIQSEMAGKKAESSGYSGSSINKDNATSSYGNQNTRNDAYNYDLSLIDSLTGEQVNNLLVDEDKFRKFMKNFKHIEEEQEKRIREAKAVALERCQSNLNLKKEINALASKLDETHEIYSQTSQSYQNFLTLNSSTLSALNPENLLTQIQVDLMELNDSSSNSIKEVLSSGDYGNLDLELKECVKLRKEYHKRAILLQKLE